MRFKKFLLLSMAAVLAASLCFSAFRSPYTPLLTAHRGNSALCPENTLAAFRSAVRQGAGCVELDVRRTADGVPVILHDENLLRTTGDSRNVGSVCWREVRRMDAGSWFSPAFSGERIPSLAEVLVWARASGIHLSVECKDPDPALVRRVVTLIRQSRMERRCLLASWDYETLRQSKFLCSGLSTVLLAERLPSDVTHLVCADGIGLPVESAAPAVSAQIHGCGKALHVWTVNTAEEVAAMLALHADNLITDDPALCTAVLAARSASE